MREDSADVFTSETLSELDGLVLRLEAIRARLDGDDAALSGELLRALDEARAAQNAIAGRAAAFRSALEQERQLYQDLVLRDITERRQAEAELAALNVELEARIADRTRELEQSHARLATVVRELPEGVLIVDPSGEIQLANRKAVEILGESIDEIARGGAFAHALGAGDAAGVKRIEFVGADGEVRVIEGSAVPVRHEHGVTAVIVTFQDVTTRERRERAERAFVTNAAHELQTPIAAITSAVEVLQAGAKERRADRDRFLEHIDRASDRLVRLTRALLVLARAQTRDEAPRREVVEVEPLLQATAAATGGVDIMVECRPDVAVIANRVLLEQALVNLVENALKHAEGAVVLRATNANGRVSIDVEDHGRGIATTDRELVFERFYRGSDSQPQGFGLGLAIVKEATEALGGELALKSGPDGTRVSLLLHAATMRAT